MQLLHFNQLLQLGNSVIRAQPRSHCASYIIRASECAFPLLRLQRSLGLGPSAPPQLDTNKYQSGKFLQGLSQCVRAKPELQFWFFRIFSFGILVCIFLKESKDLGKTESFLKLSYFEFLEFLMSFLKVGGQAQK